MSLKRKLKTALDETRLLILGAQVLLGFQFMAVVAPSMRHRLVEGGQHTNNSLATTIVFAGAALLPLALALSLDAFVTFETAYWVRNRDRLGMRVTPLGALRLVRHGDPHEKA